MGAAFHEGTMDDSEAYSGYETYEDGGYEDYEPEQLPSAPSDWSWGESGDRWGEPSEQAPSERPVTFLAHCHTQQAEDVMKQAPQRRSRGARPQPGRAPTNLSPEGVPSTNPLVSLVRPIR